MAQADLTNIRAAWREATDADVLCALRNPADFPSEVFELIQLEAGRRNIELISPVGPSPPRRLRTSGVLRRAGHFALAHRLLVAAVVGLSGRAAGFISPWALEMMTWGVWSSLFWTAYLLAISVTAWPLRRYRTIATVTLVTSCCYVLPGMAIFVFTYWGAYTAHEWLVSVSIPMGVILGSWAPICLVLCGVAYMRNRYLPVYPKGHCRNCGYNLRGTPGNMCSECGTPFRQRDVRDC